MRSTREGSGGLLECSGNFLKRAREKWNVLLLCEKKGMWSLRRRGNIWVVTWTAA